MRFLIGFLDDIGNLNSDYYICYSEKEAIACIKEKGEGTEYEKHNPFEVVGN